MTESGFEDENKQGSVTQLRYVGEVHAGIRFVDTSKSLDMDRMFQITQDDKINNFFDGVKDMDLNDIKRWAEKHKNENPRDWEVLFAISGSPEYVEPAEVGKLQGVVNFFSDKETRDKIRLFKPLLPKINNETQLVEVGIARMGDVKPGQVASALRQACIEINKLKGKGINKETGKYSKEMSPKMFVTGFVRVENIPSQKTMEHAFFENKGKITAKNVQGLEDGEYLLYFLNWEKLNDFVHKNANAAFL
jgi:hypothetical protein